LKEVVCAAKFGCGTPKFSCLLHDPWYVTCSGIYWVFFRLVGSEH
jgi:hypothetical protein